MNPVFYQISSSNEGQEGSFSPLFEDSISLENDLGEETDETVRESGSSVKDISGESCPAEKKCAVDGKRGEASDEKKTAEVHIVKQSSSRFLDNEVYKNLLLRAQERRSLAGNGNFKAAGNSRYTAEHYALIEDVVDTCTKNFDQSGLFEVFERLRSELGMAGMIRNTFNNRVVALRKRMGVSRTKQKSGGILNPLSHEMSSSKDNKGDENPSLLAPFRDTMSLGGGTGEAKSSSAEDVGCFPPSQENMKLVEKTGDRRSSSEDMTFWGELVSGLEPGTGQNDKDTLPIPRDLIISENFFEEYAQSGDLEFADCRSNVNKKSRHS